MKKKLLWRFVICYLIVMFPLFLLLNSYGVKTLRKHCIAEKRSDLYQYATNIKDKYFVSYYSGYMSLSALREQMEILDNFQHTTTWLLDNIGEISVNFENEKEEGIDLKKIYPKLLDNTYHTNLQMDSLLEEPMLSVILPVTIRLEIKGYIVVHLPMSLIEQQTVYYVNILNICFLIIAFLIFLMMLYLYRKTVPPLKKMIAATEAYSKGQFDYSITLKTNDEYKQLCDLIVYMANELSSLDDYQKKFVANISHDFRSPLTSIKGYAEAMIDGTIPIELHEKYLDIILFEAERLTKLTTNLLELNSFENQGVLLDITSFDINQMIKRIAATFEGTCRKKKIHLKLTFFEKQLFVDADMGKIQQVLYNLLDNAIKFSYNDSEIHISTIEKKDKVLVGVKDFGIGIPKDSVKKIWERFYKTDVSRGKDKKGTGLGLSITKEIMNAHGENINVISTEGVGTEFIFTLPKTYKEQI